MLHRLRALAAIVVIVSACDEDAVKPVREEIVGRWSLVERTCSIHNFHDTPGSLGHSVILQFSAGGQATVRFGSSVAVATTYDVRGSGIHHQVEFGALTFFGKEDVNAVISNDDTLELQWLTSEGGCLATLTRLSSDS